MGFIRTASREGNFAGTLLGLIGGITAGTIVSVPKYLALVDKAQSYAEGYYANFNPEMWGNFLLYTAIGAGAGLVVDSARQIVRTIKSKDRRKY